MPTLYANWHADWHEDAGSVKLQHAGLPNWHQPWITWQHQRAL